MSAKKKIISLVGVYLCSLALLGGISDLPRFSDYKTDPTPATVQYDKIEKLVTFVTITLTAKIILVLYVLLICFTTKKYSFKQHIA